MNNGTTGLGEYKDSELLAELVERGAFSEQDKKLRHVQDALNMQQKVMLEHHGRPDCKNCSLAELIQGILGGKNE